MSDAKMISAPDVYHTSNPVRDYEFTWTIDNFSLTRDIIWGRSFNPIPGFPDKLCLKLQFKQDCDDSTEPPVRVSTVQLLLVDLNFKTSKKSSLLTFSSNAWFEDTNGECVKCSERIECTNFKHEFILLNYTHESALPVMKETISWILKLLKDKLVVKGKLKISGYATATSISSLAVKYDSEASGELSKDLKTMYESGSSSDIAFEVGERTLRAHKLILRSRSPVFAKMFDSDMLESKTNNVVIEDADFHSFNCFLMFLYTGIIEDKKRETVLLLYSLAHKYQVKSLHAICSGVLGNGLSIDSVCSVLVLSDLHGDAELKNVAKTFVRCHIGQIAGTAEWVELVTTKPQLVKEVLV